MLLKIQDLLDETQCYEQLREMRWPEGRMCTSCDSRRVICRGFDDKNPGKRRYECKECGLRFDDLTGTIFAGHHQPLKVWILALYFMGLNLSNAQIAKELDLNISSAQKMTSQLRDGVLKKKTRDS